MSALHWRHLQKQCPPNAHGTTSGSKPRVNPPQHRDRCEIQPKGNISCQEHGQGTTPASPRHQPNPPWGKANQAPDLQCSFSLHRSIGKAAWKQDHLCGRGRRTFFPAWLYRPIWLWSYGKVSLPKQVSLSETYSLISWSCLNLRVGCASWFLAHSYISGNFCPSLTSIIGSLWHTALQDLNRLLFFPYTERELCARDSLNCTAQPFINGLNNEQSI